MKNLTRAQAQYAEEILRLSEPAPQVSKTVLLGAAAGGFILAIAVFKLVIPNAYFLFVFPGLMVNVYVSKRNISWRPLTNKAAMILFFTAQGLSLGSGLCFLVKTAIKHSISL